jgi:VanZ family protein
MKIGRSISAWLPPFVWLSLIFVGSTDILSAEHTSRFIVPFLHWLKPDISPQTVATIHFLIRKGGHVTEYAILASFVWRALRISFSNSKQGYLSLATFASAAAFAASDEYHQSFFASRTASMRDVLIDCAGAILAIAICWLASRRKLAK